MKKSNKFEMKLLLRIIVLAFSFSSLFWWSWAFGHMIVPQEVCFKEPRPIIVFIEFVLSGSGALGLLLLVKEEIKKD